MAILSLYVMKQNSKSLPLLSMLFIQIKGAQKKIHFHFSVCQQDIDFTWQILPSYKEVISTQKMAFIFLVLGCF